MMPRYGTLILRELAERKKLEALNENIQVNKIKRVKVGDTVIRNIHMDGDKYLKNRKGTVIWVHPKNRFYRVEFDLGNCKIRQSYKYL